MCKLEWLLAKRLMITCIDEDVEKKETLLDCWWECKLVQSFLGNSMEVLQKSKNRITVWSTNSTSGYMFMGIKIGMSKGTYIPMVISALFTITKI